MSGKIYCIDGMDGTNVSAYADRVMVALNLISTEQVRRYSYPTDGPTSSIIAAYQNEDIREDARNQNPFGTASFYATDHYFGCYLSHYRWIDGYNNGCSMVIDHYVPHLLIHQLPYIDPDQWDPFIRWTFEHEYERLELPVPDAIVILMNSGFDPEDEYDKKCYAAAKYLQSMFVWGMVDVSDEGKLLKRQEIVTKDIIRELGII